MFLACGFPLLAAWASGLKGSAQQQQAYGFVAAAGALTLVPMILITESRAGIVIGAVGLVAAAAIYRRPEQGIRTRGAKQVRGRSEEHTSELQSLMRISYAVFCVTKKNTHHHNSLSRTSNNV